MGRSARPYFFVVNSLEVFHDPPLTRLNLPPHWSRTDDRSLRVGRVVPPLPRVFARALQVGEGAQGRIRSGLRFLG